MYHKFYLPKYLKTIFHILEFLLNPLSQILTVLLFCTGPLCCLNISTLTELHEPQQYKENLCSYAMADFVLVHVSQSV